MEPTQKLYCQGQHALPEGDGVEADVFDVEDLTRVIEVELSVGRDAISMFTMMTRPHCHSMSSRRYLS